MFLVEMSDGNRYIVCDSDLKCINSFRFIRYATIIYDVYGTKFIKYRYDPTNIKEVTSYLNAFENSPKLQFSQLIDIYNLSA